MPGTFFRAALDPLLTGKVLAEPEASPAGDLRRPEKRYFEKSRGARQQTWMNKGHAVESPAGLASASAGVVAVFSKIW